MHRRVLRVGRLAIEPFTKPAGVPGPGAAQFDHLALNLPDEDALQVLRQRLKSADCDVTDIIDHGSVHSVYFTDPNGIALEASWWVLDATGRAADYGDNRFFADRGGVPPSKSSELTATSRLFQAVDFPSRPYPDTGLKIAALSPGREPATPESGALLPNPLEQDPDLERSCTDEGVRGSDGCRTAYRGGSSPRACR